MGCTCHVMRGETCSYCMEQIAELEAVDQRYCDPDGPPSGQFYNDISRRMSAQQDRFYQRMNDMTESLRFIQQPARSLREELRMGVHYDASWSE